MPKIKFTRDAGSNEGGPFKAGDIVEVPQTSADRWVRRNAAEVVKGEAAQPVTKKTTKKTKGDE